MFTRSVRKTLVCNTICTVCSTQAVYYIRLLCVKYGMHAYAGRAYICRMYAPSMLFRPTQERTLREKFARLGFRNGPTNAPDARASSVKLRRAVLHRTEMFLLHHFVSLAHP